MAAKRKSARSRAKTKVACERAGGTLRKVKPKKGPKKGKTITFCAPNKPKAKTRKLSKSSKKRSGRKLKKGEMPPGLVKACKNAKKTGFKGKKKTLRAPCAVVLASA